MKCCLIPTNTVAMPNGNETPRPDHKHQSFKMATTKVSRQVFCWFCSFGFPILFDTSELYIFSNVFVFSFLNLVLHKKGGFY